MSDKGWIGVDLDGTLAHYDGWKGPEHIGEPIKPMMDRVKAWVRIGQPVKIFTARACVPDQVAPIKAWLHLHGIGHLEITNVKDFGMIELWDDRAVQVIPNTGMRADEFRAPLSRNKKRSRTTPLCNPTITTTRTTLIYADAS